MEEKIFEGYNGNLHLSESGIKIVRGAKGFILQGMTIRGDKLIPWESIKAIQYKEAGIISGVGYIQFSILGGVESNKGLLAATQDENTITWSNIGAKKNNATFLEAKEIILSKIEPKIKVKTCPMCAEDVKIAAFVCRFCGHKF